MFNKLTLDTIHLAAKLKNNEKEALTAIYQGKWNYHDNIYQKLWWEEEQAYYQIGLGYKEHVKETHMNCRISIQHDALYNPSDELKEALKIGRWTIQDIHYAYDFQTPIYKSFSLITGNTQVERKKEWSKYNYSVGLESSHNHALVYDKKKHLEAKKQSLEHEGKHLKANRIMIPEYPLTRFEIRMKLPITKLPHLSNEADMDWLNEFIISYIQSYIFVPDVNQLPLDKWDKQLLLDIRARNNMHWNGIKLDKKKALQEVVKKNQFNFWQTYLDHKVALFEWVPLLF